jgi:hypothetical protein
MKNTISAAVLALLCAACVPGTTASIAVSRAEAPVRQFCPAFRAGAFSQDSARTYGAEQVTTFQNGSRFNCLCVVKSSADAPRCSQVRRFVLGNIEG